MRFYSTKKFGPISVAHRQWRHDGHCAYIHGYGRTVEITFEASSLDERGWVVDFGSLKDVRKWLEDQWDHRLLVAHDDPAIPAFKQLDTLGVLHLHILPEEYGPGIEQSCKFIFDYVDDVTRRATKNRCWVKDVRVWEHELNSAIYRGE